MDNTLDSTAFQAPTFIDTEQDEELIEAGDSLALASWGHLAFDLVMRIGSIDDICRVHKITKQCLSDLLRNPAMQDAIKDAKQRIEELGPEAGFTLRSRALAEDLLPDIYNIAKDAHTEPKLRKDIFDSLVRYGAIDPGANKKGSLGDGVRIQFNIGAGIRGISDVAVTS